MSEPTTIDIEALRRDIDDLRARVAAQVGVEDAEYIKSVRAACRALEVSGRFLIHVSLEPFSFSLGVISLGVYKILENMELGHNVMHGQYDFMQDPSLDSENYEWDTVSTAKTWKHAHNITHHTYTNVLGKDDDFGWFIFRLSSDLPWKPMHIGQSLVHPLGSLVFDHVVAWYHARPSEYLTGVRGSAERSEQIREMLGDWTRMAGKTVAQTFKEYVFYPALAGPFAPKVVLGNALAQILRNVWTYAVIQCGHLPRATSTFVEADLVGETRGSYYLRQIMGSSNIDAGPLFGVLTGHLSHQIEHHLFPTLPARRYREMGREVRRICEQHGIPYNTGSFGRQFRSVLQALVCYSFPNAPSDEHRRGARAFKRPVRHDPAVLPGTYEATPWRAAALVEVASQSASRCPS